MQFSESQFFKHSLPFLSCQNANGVSGIGTQVSKPEQGKQLPENGAYNKPTLPLL